MMRRDAKWTHKLTILWGALLMALLLGGGMASAQSKTQPAILTTAGTSNRVVVFPDAANAPATQKLVNLPDDAKPYSVAYYSSDNALISDIYNSRIFVVRVSTATLLATIDTSAAGYSGSGTIAVAPDRNTALAMGSQDGNDTTLYVIRGPFSAASQIDKVTLPDGIRDFQPEAIVFNRAGRAFVYTKAGISVLDAPYNRVAFTIPVPDNDRRNSIAITPDGNTLLTTKLGNQVSIFKAPFSAASTPTLLTVPNGAGLKGIEVSPDGSKAIVVSGFAYRAAAISAPFTSNSTVEDLPLPANGSSDFDDVDISPDGQTALLTGNGFGPTDLPVRIRAPFTAAGATSTVIPIQNVAETGRGIGVVRFQSAAPGLTITKSAAASVASGANLTYTLNFFNTGNTNTTGIVIRDTLPAGTVFVSATSGGTLQNGVVVFSGGSLVAGTGGNVSFTVRVTAAAGQTVNNNGYTIEANDVAPTTGPPVTTMVTVTNRVVGQGTIIAAGQRYSFSIDVSGDANGNASGSAVATNGRNDFVRSAQITNLTVNGNTATISGIAVRKRKSFRFTLFVSDTRFANGGAFNVRSSGGNGNSRVMNGFLNVTSTNGGGQT